MSSEFFASWFIRTFDPVDDDGPYHGPLGHRVPRRMRICARQRRAIIGALRGPDGLDGVDRVAGRLLLAARVDLLSVALLSFSSRPRERCAFAFGRSCDGGRGEVRAVCVLRLELRDPRRPFLERVRRLLERL